MKAEDKNPAIDALLTDLSGKDRVESINTGTCATCNDPNMNFNTPLDRREYEISGMCQKCQDVAFAVDEEDD
jgi:hypothetical protein